jgi:DNA helicase-2/ATP-dependent DNA helicase PcrA
LSGASGIQRDLALLPPSDLLVLAPAGCGKTEALAFRAAGLVVMGHVPRRQKLLALTFSNRARDNLANRLTNRLGGAAARRFVTVHNFHGFSARLISAHAATLGLHDVVLPDRRWVVNKFEELGTPVRRRREASRVIREAKQRFLDDADVARAIEASGSDEAVELEHARISEGRLDFDDLIRYAVALIRIEPVAALYRAHFAALLIDEMQDMTERQLDLVHVLHLID